MEWIKIGVLIKPFGIKGEMRVYSMTDFVEERFKKGKTVYLKTDKGHEPFKVASFRMHKDEPLVSFEGYQDINLIEKYAKAEIEIRKEDLHRLKEGEYYFFELNDTPLLVHCSTQISRSRIRYSCSCSDCDSYSGCAHVGATLLFIKENFAAMKFPFVYDLEQLEETIEYWKKYYSSSLAELDDYVLDLKNKRELAWVERYTITSALFNFKR